ncbi:MAG: hypothetical protein ACOYBL_08885 [Lachnospiraceae bacterium]|jgi:hypothetical protein
MEPIIKLTQVDYATVFISVFSILIGMKVIISLFEWFIDKLGLETKGMRKQREEHELLIATANGLKDLATEHKHDIDKIYDDNMKWRNHSREIILKNEKIRSQQIESLTIANRELLAGKINDKYKYYITINGIPEDEVDEFTALHSAYNACGGNHQGDTKYNYIMKHLSVIPVKTKLVYKEDK